jgi:hypothetical protein
MKCRNCGHAIKEVNKAFKHTLVNHGMFCPCRKPEPTINSGK